MTGTYASGVLTLNVDLENKSPVLGGTDVTLLTTGEKYKIYDSESIANTLASGLVPLVDISTGSKSSISKGQIIYLKNDITLSDGLYRATELIPSDTDITSQNVRPMYPMGLLNEMAGWETTTDNLLNNSTTGLVKQVSDISSELSNKASTDVATTSTNGLMSATDKIKLDLFKNVDLTGILVKEVDASDTRTDTLNEDEYIYLTNHLTLNDGFYQVTEDITTSDDITSNNIIATSSDGILNQLHDLIGSSNGSYTLPLAADGTRGGV